MLFGALVRGRGEEGQGVVGNWEKWCQCVVKCVSGSASTKRSTYSSDPTSVSPFRLHWSGYLFISCDVCVYIHFTGSACILCRFTRPIVVGT